MKPAVDWGNGGDDDQAPDPSNPHAQVAPGADPHAGLDMNGDDDMPDPSNPHAGLDMSGGGGDNPHGGGMGAQTIDPNKYLTGTIELTDQTKDKVPAGARLFIYAEALGPDGNPVKPPIAVAMPVPVSTFPMTFRIDDSNVIAMDPSNPRELEGKVAIIAWINQSGDVSTHTPGDLEGMVEATVPAKDVVVKLDTIEQ